MSQANSAEEHKLVSSFETVRRTLLQEQYRDRLEKPLAYWALPNDRRLPLAFLGRPLGELLKTPFSELSSTRGIGQKKISSLVKLLHRATNEAAPAVPFGLRDLAEQLEAQREVEDQPQAVQGFDPALVSEAHWVQWCETVERFHLGREMLGRLAPSLQALPTVIWRTPLHVYLDKSLAEIRQLKTHGEKRVRGVLEIFCAVHEALQGVPQQPHLACTLLPAFVPQVEDFVVRLLGQDPIRATRDELATHLVQPLLDQIRIDSGEAVHALSRDRLGVGVPAKTVREQAHELGVTRARVYQLLEDCGKVMSVRWPGGRQLLKRLGSMADSQAQRLLRDTRQLFFPEKGDQAEELDEAS